MADIYKSGFDVNLIRTGTFGSLFYPAPSFIDVGTPAVPNVSSSPVDPTLLTGGGGGNIGGNITLEGGFLQSSNFVTGSTGWQLTDTSGELNFAVSVDSLDIPDTTTANSFHVESDGDTFWGATNANFTSNNDNANAYVLKTGVAKFQTVTLSGSVAISGIANDTNTDIALLDLTHDLVFSVTDADTIAWASGTINLSNARTFSIDSGNTGNMAALTYIYLDPDTSATVLQTTTTYSTAIGADKILIGVAQNQTTTASYIPFNGGGKTLLDGEQLGAVSIGTAVIANLAVTNAKINDLNVSKLVAGTITGQSIVLAASGGGDAEIRSGIATGDFNNSSENSGFIIGVDDSDSDLAKFYFGDKDQHIEWDGAGLTVVGDLTAGKRIYFYGDGAEGALEATGSTTINGTVTSIDASSASGQAVLNVTTTTGYSVGDHVLIHQTQGTGAGLWEIRKIASISSGVSLTMGKNLTNSYAATGAQVIEIKEHTSVVFKGSASVGDSAWGGTTGGVVVFYSSEGVLIENGTTLSLDGDGFRGGAGHVDIGFQGESEDGAGSQSTAANGLGGGGAGDNAGSSADGGGGGLKENGTAGTTLGGTGGANLIDAISVYTNGDGNMVLLFGGAGGGNHATLGGNERTGGDGGGIFIILAPFIWVGGVISSDGATGAGVGGAIAGAGGGGTVALFTEQLFGDSSVTVAGGVTADTPGGDGGDGYIIKGIPGGLPTS